MPVCDRLEHEIDHDVVTVILDPGESVVAEAGALAWYPEGLAIEARMSAGDQPSGVFGLLGQVASRMVAGESMWLTHCHWPGPGRARVAFSPAFSGQVVAVDLEEMGGGLLVQRGAFLCAARGTGIGVRRSGSVAVSVFGGEGWVLLDLKGDGLACLAFGGHVVERTLAPREKLVVDTGSVGAFAPGVTYDIARVGGLKTSIFGGEGFFSATLTGPGRVWLQSVPVERTARYFATLAGVDDD